jgi:aldose sugar dehydrogenase
MTRTRVALGAALLLGCAGGSMSGPAFSAARTEAAPPYLIDTLATGLKHPWSLAFLPGEAMLVTEKYGGIKRYPKGSREGTIVQGSPEAMQREDSGLLDIALDPRFGDNHLVYISFSEGDSSANHTALFRGRLDGDRLLDGRVIFRASPDKAGPNHPGSRIVFLPDETLLLSIGEGFDYRDQAQQLGSTLGKLLRLDREGRPPADNPFVDSAGVKREIYSYGHRNPQGLLVDPRDSTVWEHEHGPRGGDEMLQETLLRELKSRIRDVRNGPEGFLYLVTDDDNGSVLRLRPRQ